MCLYRLDPERQINTNISVKTSKLFWTGWGSLQHHPCRVGNRVTFHWEQAVLAMVMHGPCECCCHSEPHVFMSLLHDGCHTKTGNKFTPPTQTLLYSVYNSLAQTQQAPSSGRSVHLATCAQFLHQVPSLCTNFWMRKTLLTSQMLD